MRVEAFDALYRNVSTHVDVRETRLMAAALGPGPAQGGRDKHTVKELGVTYAARQTMGARGISSSAQCAGNARDGWSTGSHVAHAPRRDEVDEKAGAPRPLARARLSQVTSQLQASTGGSAGPLAPRKQQRAAMDSNLSKLCGSMHKSRNSRTRVCRIATSGVAALPALTSLH
jgi:hypothetical protein